MSVSYRKRWITLGFVLGFGAGIVLAMLAWPRPAKGQSMEQDADHTDVPDIADLIFSRSGETPEEVAMVARYFDSKTIYPVTPGVTNWGSGLLVRLGDGFGYVPGPGEPLLPGQYVNISPEAAALDNGDGTYVVVDPMETVSVSSWGTRDVSEDVIRDWLRSRTLPDEFAGPAPGKACVVQCGPGYYACCNATSPPSCVCKQNSQPNAVCSAGGPGSTSCGASEGPLTPVEP